MRKNNERKTKAERESVTKNRNWHMRKKKIKKINMNVRYVSRFLVFFFFFFSISFCN